ncbi:MAG TPA: membrane protein insertase YidC [Actinomycetes bacterium]|nr:membrane protein insertase YidC [Actinomycetes bacterium]
MLDFLNTVLGPLEYVVSWILVEFHALFSLVFAPTSGWAWGGAIVGLVVVIRILLIPLFVKQIKAQRGLQLLQPRIKELQKRHKDDRQKQSEELMKLYKETGTNPFSSCLPILAQMPIFFALFRVINYGIARQEPVGAMTQQLSEQAAQATIFGAPIDATFIGSPGETSVRIVTVVMILLMSASTFFTQRQLMVKNMPAGQDNPMMQQQKILLYVFPLMFAVFGINFPVGVLIYWLTTNLWTAGQQYYVIRRNPAPGSPAYDALQERRKAKETGRGGTAPVVEAAPEAAPKPPRQQPKRKPRSQRKGGANPPQPNKAGGSDKKPGAAGPGPDPGSGTPEPPAPTEETS